MKKTKYVQSGIWDSYEEPLWKALICSKCRSDRNVRFIWSKLPGESYFSFHRLCPSCKVDPLITLE